MRTKTWINISVREKTHQQVMLFKIKTKAKTLDEVIAKAMKALREIGK